MISRRFCQRERSNPIESLRVMSFEPTASTSISPHVNTMVALSLKNPCCQKMISSGLRRMAGHLRRGAAVPDRRAGKPRHDQPRDDEAEQTRQQPVPTTARDEIEPGQDDARFGAGGCRETTPPAVSDVTPLRTVHQRPPKKTAPSSTPAPPASNRLSGLTHPRPPVPPGWPRLPWKPSATRSQHPIARPATSSASVQERPPG